jgi:hypothetical protein
MSSGRTAAGSAITVDVKWWNYRRFNQLVAELLPAELQRWVISGGRTIAGWTTWWRNCISWYFHGIARSVISNMLFVILVYAQSYTAASCCTILQEHSTLPVIQTQQVSTNKAIIKCTNCGGNCCPFVTLLHYEIQLCKVLTKHLIFLNIWCIFCWYVSFFGAVFSCSEIPF